MDVERIIDDIEQLQEMFEAPGRCLWREFFLMSTLGLPE
jgi:hypothetical protein